MTRRLEMTYETPLGTRTLSSSTRQPPCSSRIRSMPDTWMRTPLALSTPAAARWKCAEEVIRPAGMTPSRTAFWAPYTSLRNASNARTRCFTPASIRDHSACSITRGTASSGNGRSSPAKSNVTPCARYELASASVRPRSSSCVSAASAANSSR